MKRLAFLLALTCFAAPKALVASPFADGDRVVCWGDSITHGGYYVQMLTDFYLTRHPDRNVRIYNAGVSGDNAGDALSRFEDDVLRRSPTVVTLMFGMNDSWREGLYHPSLLTNAAHCAALPEKERACYATYVTNMTRLVERVQKDLPQARMMFLTPTPYDETAIPTATRKTPALKGTAAALRRFAAFGRATAAKTGGEVVDWNASVQALVDKEQAKNPDFSFVRADRVHPDEPGHLFMVYEFLKTQGATNAVSDVAISATDGRVIRAANAAVSDFEKTAEGCAFTVLEKALPYPILENAKSALAWAPIQETLNRETLSVTGLKAGGRHSLFIDGERVGGWTAEEFAKGIDLGGNAKTPQARQAAEVGRLNAERCAIERGKLRKFAAVRWILRKFGVDADDFAAVQAYYDGLSDARKQGYFERMFPEYVRDYGQKSEIERDQDVRWANLLKLRQPRPHRYEIRRTISNGAIAKLGVSRSE